MSLAERLGGLERVGVGDDGVQRLAWTDADREARAWFRDQAEAAGLLYARDPAGNLWAHPATPPPWWGVGSHLDSVRGGGRFDGPLGVACGFEIAARGRVPIAVISFADEEGARFNTPLFGSKALTGALDLPAVLARRDDCGISLQEAIRDDGLDPERLDRASEWLSRLSGFIEMHIDQTTELADAEVAIGVVSALVTRTRLEVTLIGRADHAGTTSQKDRRDALGAAARLIVAAEDRGRARSGMTVTSSRILVEPNATTTIASLVRLWIDARSPAAADVDAWLGDVRGEAAELAQRTGVAIDITVASRSEGRAFAGLIREQLSEAARTELGSAVPETLCFAGHDAGVMAARVPAAMVLVRNATGVSHSPFEQIDLADAEIGTSVIERALMRLVKAAT